MVGIEVAGASGEEMLEEVVNRWDSGPYAEARPAAVNKRSQAPQEGCGTQRRSQRERQPCAGCVGIQVHGDGVESIDVAGRVVNGRVKSYRVRAAVGQSKEGIAGCVSDGRSETAEQIRGGAVLKGVFEAGKIGEGAGASLVERAHGKQHDFGLGERCG